MYSGGNPPADKRGLALEMKEEHNFVESVCSKCSLREKDSQFRAFQFCTDEMKNYVLFCRPEKKSEILFLYSSDPENLSELYRLVGYRSLE